MKAIEVVYVNMVKYIQRYMNFIIKMGNSSICVQTEEYVLFFYSTNKLRGSKGRR
jgi:hypothetical protein